jgi:hypothetical protein
MNTKEKIPMSGGEKKEVSIVKKDGKEIISEDLNKINQIVNYFQENIRNRIFQKLISYYDIVDYHGKKLGGFVIRKTKDYTLIIEPQKVLNEILRQIQISSDKNIRFGELMLNTVLQNTPKIYIENKKKKKSKKSKNNNPESKNLKQNSEQNQNKNKNEGHSNHPYGWIM